MENIHFRHRPLVGNSWPQAADDSEIADTHPEPLWGEERMLKVTRAPDIGRRKKRKLNVCRQHADDAVRVAIQSNGLVQDARVAAKTAMPERVTDNDDRLAGGLAFIGQKEASHLGPDAEHIKKICRDTR